MQAVSPCIPDSGMKGTGTQKYNEKRLCGRGPTLSTVPEASTNWQKMLVCAGLFLDEDPADTAIALLHQSAVQEKALLPSSISAERGSEAVDQPVQLQCAQVFAALRWTVESPKSPHTWAVLQGGRCMRYFTLALILSRQNVCYLAFQPLKNLYPK